jgi:hypothetical protein
MLVMIQYFGGRYVYGRPIDLGIALGSGAIVLIGLSPTQWQSALPLCKSGWTELRVIELQKRKLVKKLVGS